MGGRPNLTVHRTVAAGSDCGILVTALPRPVTCLFGGEASDGS